MEMFLYFSTLKAPNGAFSSRLKTLTWSGTKVSQLYALNPGEQRKTSIFCKIVRRLANEKFGSKKYSLRNAY